jgi:hypothetical protein
MPRLRSKYKESKEKDGSSSGVTHRVSMSVLMNSRASNKFML